jgi:uncharacterized protein (UPF0264 family)
MANEISVSLGLSVNNGNYVESFQASGLRYDQTTQLASAGITNIGTATVATIALGEITTAGFAAFRNLSTATSGTAYIALGAYDGTNLHEFVHLRRGQPAVLPLDSNVTVGAKAYGTANKLRYVILAE